MNTWSPWIRARILVGVIAAAGLAACTGGQTAPSTPTAAPSPEPTRDSGLVLATLGDSYPGGLGCEVACVPYPERLKTLLGDALAAPVTLVNLATNDSATSVLLQSRVEDDPVHRKAIAEADAITIQVGFNDWQGLCSWEGHEACLARGQGQVETAMGKILAEISAIREGRPVATRVLTYPNNYLGDPRAAKVWGFDDTPEAIESFDADYGAALVAFDTMLCEVAQAAGATCVDLLHAFNGEAGATPAGDLIGPDGVHPSDAGHTLIAETVAAAGFDDIPRN